MKLYTSLLALMFSFNAFCQSPTYKVGSATVIRDPNTYSAPSMDRIMLPSPGKEESSSAIDTIPIKFHILSSFYVKGIKQCKDCIVKGSEGIPLTAKFKKYFVRTNEGPVDSVFSLIGGSIKCKFRIYPTEIVGITKIVSQKKYVVNYKLMTDDKLTDNKCKEYTREFWIAIPKVENGFKIEYDFQIE